MRVISFLTALLYSFGAIAASGGSPFYDNVPGALPTTTVFGPGAAVTDNAIVRWDGTSGTLIQDSNATLADDGSLTIDSTSLFVSGSNARVGLGTVSPSATLHITRASAATSGSVVWLRFTPTSDTGLTASTSVPLLDIQSDDVNRTWATGNATSFEETRITQPSWAFAGSSTIDFASTVRIAGAPKEGTNAVFTEAAALTLAADSSSTAATVYSLYAAQPTGGTSANYAARLGNLTVATNTIATTTGNLTLSAATNAGTTITRTASTSGVVPVFSVSVPADTGMTANTSAPLFSVGDGTTVRTYAAGGGAGVLHVAGFDVLQPIISVANNSGASNITNVAGARIAYPKVVATGTGTLNPSYVYALNIPSAAVDDGSSSVTTAYGIAVGNPTGATNNYSGYFEGRVGIGTDGPTEMVDVTGNIKASGTVTAGTGATITSGNLTLSSGGVVQTSTATTSDANTFVADSLTTGDAVQISSNSADTSARSVLYVLQDHASASAALGMTVQQDGANYNALLLRSTTSSNAALRILNNNATTGDASISFGVGSTAAWAAGIDQSASNAFKLSYQASTAATLGTGDMLTITTAGAATLAGALTITSGGITYTGGVQRSLYVPAGSFYASTTNGCGALTTREIASGQPDVHGYPCDASTDESVQFDYQFPRSYNLSTMTAAVDWTYASGSGDVVWGVQCVATGNDDTLNVAYGTAVTVIDTGLATNDEMRSPTSSAMTVGGTPADADTIHCRVYRDADAVGDTLAADAEFLGLELLFTADQEAE